MNCHNTKGVWRLHSWPKISMMTDLSLFRMALHEKWVRGVLIPETNKEISGDDSNLQEFYVYLGCHFLMACFEGISDRRLWWSPKTGINSGRKPLPDAEVHVPLTVHINYLPHEVYKKSFSFIFG